MITNPIIPIWLMAIICVAMLCFKRKGVWAFIRQIIIVCLLFAINLRIMLPGEVEELGEQDLDLYVLFVVDDTISMVARDYQGNQERLVGVKNDIQYIVDKLVGAKFGVMSFHNTVNQLSPFTNNTEHITNVVNAIYPLGEIYAHGTTVNIVHKPMLETLEYAYNKADGHIVVFMMTDGEITDDSRLESFADLSKFIEGGAVMGYGTEQGGNMYLKGYYDDVETLIEDKSSYPYEPALSKIDEQTLNSLSKDMGISYVRMSKTENIDAVLDEVTRIASLSFVEAGADERRKIDGSVDIYYFFLIPLLAMLILESLLFVRKKR